MQHNKYTLKCHLHSLCSGKCITESERETDEMITFQIARKFNEQKKTLSR